MEIVNKEESFGFFCYLFEKSFPFVPRHFIPQQKLNEIVRTRKETWGLLFENHYQFTV